MQSNSTFKKVHNASGKVKVSYQAEQEGNQKGRKKDPVWKSNQRNAPKRNWIQEN